jgi:CheY-like chemotaxis protein
MGGTIRILIADDHTLVRESLVSLLQGAGDVQVVAQAADGLETVTKAIATRPDIVVTDIAMPRLNGIEVVRRLREALPVPEARTSTQPRFGQLPWHGGPAWSMTTWPSSAPAPVLPR